MLNAKLLLLCPNDEDPSLKDGFAQILAKFLPVWSKAKFGNKAEIQIDAQPLVFSYITEPMSFLYKTMREFYDNHDVWIVGGQFNPMNLMGLYDFNKMVYGYFNPPPPYFSWRGTTIYISHEMEHMWIDKLKLDSSLHNTIHQNVTNGLFDLWDSDFNLVAQEIDASFETVGLKT